MASLYLATNRQTEADSLLIQILSAQPDFVEALVLRGQLRTEQLRFDEAIADLRHATRAQPALAPAHYYLATALLRKGDVKLAEAELRGALELEPGFAAARILLAGIELDAGEVKESLTDLDKVLAAKPATISPYLMQSMILAEHGDAARAEKDLLPLLDVFSEPSARAATYRALAWVSINQRKYEQARTFLAQADKLQPPSRETFYLLGLTYIDENRSDIAVSLVKARLRENPTLERGLRSCRKPNESG